MSSKSEAQAVLMRAAANTKGGYGGVPQSVGREFVLADMGRKFGPPIKTPPKKAKRK